MAVRIGLTGDVMFGRIVDERQRTRPVTAVWGDVLDHLRSLDGLCINLECCLSTRGQPWRRTHRVFHFRADPDWAVPALEAAGVDCCSLANNHVLDFEVPALRDTLGSLADANIPITGAGLTRTAAFAPAVVTIDDLTVAVVSLTDNTPEYAAGEGSPGTAYVEMDADNPETRAAVSTSLARVAERDPDLVIASLHWGPNMVERPPAAFQVFARWLLAEGVDVIHGHSAHVFQGVEVLDGKPICYDTGDFVDDYAVDAQLRNDRSFLFELGVETDGTLLDLRLRPTEIDDCAVHWAKGDAAEWSRTRMRTLSGAFGMTFERDGPALVTPLGH